MYIFSPRAWELIDTRYSNRSPRLTFKYHAAGPTACVG